MIQKPIHQPLKQIKTPLMLLIIKFYTYLRLNKFKSLSKLIRTLKFVANEKKHTYKQTKMKEGENIHKNNL